MSLQRPRYAMLLLVVALLFPLFAFAQTSNLATVQLQITQTTTNGNSVYVAGSIPELGNWDVTKAIKLSPHAYPLWQVTLKIAPGTTFEYRFLTRTDGSSTAGSTSNGTYLGTGNSSMTVPGTPLPARTGVLRYFSGISNPTLQILNTDGSTYRSVATVADGPGRGAGETLWRADLTNLPATGDWQFRFDLGGGTYDKPPDGSAHYLTSLTTLWLQDGQIYNYKPPATVSGSQVYRISAPAGEIPARQLYIYLPRGYAENPTKQYPVLYMHDGQNLFARAADGPFGQWNADTMADKLISQGRMRETIIVGVANSNNRILEYLPPYSSYGGGAGIADKTFRYYRDTVEPTVLNAPNSLRIKPGRENRAVCGSSMGGVISNYIGWEFPEFAKHLGMVSTAYWITDSGGGTYQLVARMQPPAARRDVRMWIDSGTVGSSDGDDFKKSYAARDALIQNGYVLGDDVQHHVAIGANHSEGSWAARLDKILLYLLPISQEETSVATPTPTPSPSPSASATPTATPSPSASPSPTPSATPSPTASVSPTPSPSATPAQPITNTLILVY